MPITTRSMTAVPKATNPKDNIQRTIRFGTMQKLAAEKAALAAAVTAEVNKRREHERVFKETVDYLVDRGIEGRTKTDHMIVVTQLYKLINSDLPTIYRKNPDLWFRMVVAIHSQSTDLINDFTQHHLEVSEPIVKECEDELRAAQMNMAQLIQQRLFT
jgi:hypothetical protein